MDEWMNEFVCLFIYIVCLFVYPHCLFVWNKENNSL